MDNDDKVKDLVLRSKNLFLKDIQKEMEKSELYNLDEEFAKTKKNRSPLVWITIILFVVVFVGIAVLVNAYIQREARNIDVSIQAFEDVNLREVLDKAKQYERELMEARRKLRDLIAARDSEIEQLSAAVQRQINVLNTRNMTQAARNREIAALQAKLENDIAAVREKHRPAIEAAEREIALIEEKMAAYDSRMVSMAKEQEAVLNNQQRLYELRQQETVDYYEAQLAELQQRMTAEQAAFDEYRENLVDALEKNHQEEVERLILTYNPRFTEPELKGILQEEMKRSEDPIEFGFKRVLSQERLYTEDELAEQYRKINNIRILVERLRAIPYINSVPPALEYVENAMYEVVREYEELWQDLADAITTKTSVIRARDSVIEEFKYALNSLVSVSRENGYVLDSRNPEALVVFIGDLYEVSDGETGYVFREDDEYIAGIQFYQRAGRLFGRVVEQADPPKEIRPFDKILVEKK